MGRSPVYLDSMGHLWSPDRDELHAMAAAIGMRREWFQDRPVLYHYDVMSQAKRRAALLRGTVAIEPRELVVMMRGASDGKETR